MAERKAKRESEGLAELDSEENGFVIEPTQVELGSGYTLSVKYDEHHNPIVNVKTYGQVDIAHLKREIEKAFPNAQIRQLNNPQPVIVTKQQKKPSNKKKRK